MLNRIKSTVRTVPAICVCLVSGVLLVLGACAPAPDSAPLRSEALSKVQMLEILQRSYANHSLKTLAEVEFTRGEQTQSSTQALHVQEPYRLRAEVYNFIGQMVVLLAADGAALEAYVPSRKMMYSGMATRERMEEFTSIPLMPADMVAVLLLRLPPGVMQLAETRAVGGNALQFKLSELEDYLVHFSAHRIERITYRQMGHEVYTVACRYALDSTGSGTGVYPRAMEVSMPEQQLHLHIAFDGPQLNQEIDLSMFKLTPPVGTTLTPLKEL